MKKTIQILGTGCPKCQQLAEHARIAAEELGLDYELRKITDLRAIAGFGVMMTPALAVDGQVKSAGKVLAPDAIKPLIQG
jgi:small redox-active disulfide protein 2